MPFPGSRRIDEVQVLLGAHPLEVAFAAANSSWKAQAETLGLLLSLAALQVDDVAHGAEVHAFHAHQVADVRRAFHADPDEADPQGLLGAAEGVGSSPTNSEGNAANDAPATADRFTNSRRVFVQGVCVMSHLPYFQTKCPVRRPAMKARGTAKRTNSDQARTMTGESTTSC